MAKLTIRIDDELLRRARARAEAEGTSVGAVLRGCLEVYVRDAPRAEARRRLVALAERSGSGSGAGGRSWTRDELYG
jgi:plasmid stability protein